MVVGVRAGVTGEVWQSEEQQGIEGRHFLSCGVSSIPRSREDSPGVVNVRGTRSSSSSVHISG